MQVAEAFISAPEHSLGLALSAYYGQRAVARDPDRVSARAECDAAVSVNIDEVWADNRKVCGARAKM